MKQLVLSHNKITGAIELRLGDELIPVRVESFFIEDDESNNSVMHIQIKTFPNHTWVMQEEE